MVTTLQTIVVAKDLNSGLAAEFIIFSTQFLVFDTQFLVFDTQFLVFITKFMSFTHASPSGSQPHASCVSCTNHHVLV